jgi:hypothetical protein
MANNKKFNIFDIMEEAAAGIGIDFSNVGENIAGISVEQISKLPLEQRKIVVSKLGEKAPEWMLKKLFGENWLGAKLMARYIGGSGEDYHLDISKKDWNKLTNLAKTQANRVGGWTPSTNPDFPSEKGWEYVSNVQSTRLASRSWDIEYDVSIPSASRDLYNALGETTIRRRPVGKGKYEYQIAGETFDFVEGKEGKGGQRYGAFSSRTVSPKGAKIINTLFPEYTYASQEFLGDKSKAEIWSEQNMVEFGTPFKVKSRYIGK